MLLSKRTSNLILLLTINWLVRCTGQIETTRTIVNDNVNSFNKNNTTVLQVKNVQQTSNLTIENVTLSFTNQPKMPISKGQILLSPSNKVTTKIDLQSLINKTANSKINSLQEFTQKSINATNLSSSSYVNNLKQNNNLNQFANQIKKKQFSRTRRRRRRLDRELDENVFKFYNEQKSINMAKNPKFYEIVMKSKRSSDGVESITLGAILPKTALITKFRSYQKRLQDAVEDLMGSKSDAFHSFLQRFRIAQAQLVLLSSK